MKGNGIWYVYCPKCVPPCQRTLHVGLGIKFNKEGGKSNLEGDLEFTNAKCGQNVLCGEHVKISCQHEITW
jgi:hypothetical protein